MKIMKKNKLLSAKNGFYAIYTLAFAVLFFVFIGGLFGHSISHSYPFTYFAQDSFSHLAVERALASQGNFATVPAYMNAGISNGLPHNGPGEAHISYLFSRMSGIADYDAIFLITGILILLMPLLLLSALKLSWQEKILSLSLMPLLFVPNFNIGLLWGQIGAVYGLFLMMVFFLALSVDDFKKNPLILGIILAASAVTHFPEFFFLAIFFAIYLLISNIKHIKKGFGEVIKMNRYLIVLTIIFIILTSYYLNILLRQYTTGRRRFFRPLKNKS